MIFLQPFLLVLGVLAGIPVLIHLFGERRYREQIYPDLRLLEEIRSRSLQSIQIRQWLILAARVLWMLCLIAALASPFFKASVFLGTEADPGIVLLDRTESMVLRAEPEADIAMIRQAFPDWTYISYGPGHQSADSAVSALRRILRETSAIRPDLLLYSDLQDNEENESIRDFLRGRAELGEIFVLSPETAAGNVSLSSHQTEKSYLPEGRALYRIRSQLSGDSRLFSTVSLQGEGIETAQFTVSPDGQAEYSFSTTEKRDAAAVTLSIPADSRLGDNMRYLLLPMQSSKDILHIQAFGGGSYLPAALRSMSGFTVRSIYGVELSGEDLYSYDLIILEGQDAVLREQRSRILDAAKTVPLLSVPAGHERPPLLDARIGAERRGAPGAEAFLRLQHIHRDYTFAGFKSGRFGLRSYWKIGTGEMALNSEDIWVLENGDPICIKNSDSGVHTLLSPFDFTMNRMGLDPWFLTLLRSLFRGMLEEGSTEISAGEALGPGGQEKIRVLLPDGREWKGEGVFTETEEPGIYTVIGNRGMKRYAVNIREEESRITEAVYPDAVSAGTVAEQAGIDMIHRLRRGRSAADFFLLAALLFFAAEMLLLSIHRKGSV